MSNLHLQNELYRAKRLLTMDLVGSNPTLALSFAHDILNLVEYYAGFDSSWDESQHSRGEDGKFSVKSSTKLSEKAYSLIPLSAQKLIIDHFVPKDDFQRISVDLMQSADIQTKAQEYGLTFPEQIALRYWSSDGFSAFNGVLHKTLDWSDTQMQTGLQAVALLRQALDKLPNYTREVVYSRQDFPDDLIDQLLQDAQYTFEGFIAGNIGYDLLSHRKQRFIVKSKTGKHIAWISENADTENEVLFKNSASFMLADIETHEDNPNIQQGHTWFRIEEI